MTNTKKQKPNVAVRLEDGLETYLRQQAIQGHRSISAEIRMRLERTRQLDKQAPKGNS